MVCSQKDKDHIGYGSCECVYFKEKAHCSVLPICVFIVWENNSQVSSYPSYN